MAPRPLADVPATLRWLLAAALLLQALWHAGLARDAAVGRDLPPAPPLAALRLASLGEPIALARLLTLELQGYEDQPGVSVAWHEYDFVHLRDWLGRALDLDPRGQYPLFLASEVYAGVSDPARCRVMLEFVSARFGQDPDRRWPWLAQAAIVARHRLHDLPLARQYARAIRERATGPGVPAWAREMEVFVAEDMNEPQQAQVLIGGLLSSGQITDPHELAFLSRRLERLKAPQRGQRGP